MQFKNHKAKFKYIFILLLAAFFLGNSGFRKLVKNYMEFRRLNTQKAELEREKVRLEKELKTMKEPGHIEQTARKELGLKKPDELEYRFQPPKKDTE